MECTNRPTIWRYLIWGLIIGLIGSLFLAKYFMIQDMSKYVCFQKLFGTSFAFEAIDNYGNTYAKQYYEYISELLALPMIGIILGVTVGISNCSFRTTFFAISGGILAGSIIPYFYPNLVTEPFFLENIPNLLFWYATSITIFLTTLNFKKKNIWLLTIISLILSFLVTRFIYFVGWLSLFASIGEGFAGRSSEAPQILVGIIAIALLNVTINLPQWKMKN